MLFNQVKVSLNQGPVIDSKRVHCIKVSSDQGIRNNKNYVVSPN